MFICKGSLSFQYFMFVPFVLRYHLESFDRWFIVRWITVWCFTGSWWGTKRIPSFPHSLLALLCMFSLLWRGKVVLGWTLTPPPIAIFVIFGRAALNWASTLFSFPIISAIMAWRCVGCYHWNFWNITFLLDLTTLVHRWYRYSKIYTNNIFTKVFRVFA